MPFLSDNRLNPECIRMLSWNIQKQRRPQLQDDLAGFSREIDLALLQEVHAEGNGLTHFDGDWHRSFAPGYALPGRTTGVMTLSSACHLSHSPLRHPEPLLRIPKATNLTTYALDGCDETLLVINLHAVNFSLGMNSYQRQLQQLLPVIDGHRGPVIFAGDFNAWHNNRKQLVQDIAGRHGLQEVIFEEDNRTHFFGRHLDYVFVRGLRVSNARACHSNGSDHNPLLVTVSL